MAAVPERIRIGPLTYTVEHSHQAIREYGQSAGNDAIGLCQNRICRILVDEGMPLQRERVTLTHEVVHAIHCVYHLDDLNLANDDEHYVDVFATAFTEVLQENPALVAYLTAQEGEC